MIFALDSIFAIFLFQSIERVPYFSTTPQQFELWNQQETSPYEVMESTVRCQGPPEIVPCKKYTLKRKTIGKGTKVAASGDS